MHFPLRIAVRPSRAAAATLFLLHLLAALLLFRHPLLGTEARLWLAILCGLVLSLSLAHALLVLRRLPASLILHADGSLQCGGSMSPAEVTGERWHLSGTAVLFSSVLWFRLPPGARPRGLMLWRDSCSRADWRLLRLWLRHQPCSLGQIRQSDK